MPLGRSFWLQSIKRFSKQDFGDWVAVPLSMDLAFDIMSDFISKDVSHRRIKRLSILSIFSHFEFDE